LQLSIDKNSIAFFQTLETAVCEFIPGNDADITDIFLPRIITVAVLPVGRDTEIHDRCVIRGCAKDGILCQISGNKD
jgi:hypothetical protein